MAMIAIVIIWCLYGIGVGVAGAIGSQDAVLAAFLGGLIPAGIASAIVFHMAKPHCCGCTSKSDGAE